MAERKLAITPQSKAKEVLSISILFPLPNCVSKSRKQYGKRRRLNRRLISTKWEIAPSGCSTSRAPPKTASKTASFRSKTSGPQNRDRGPASKRNQGRRHQKHAERAIHDDALAGISQRPIRNRDLKFRPKSPNLKDKACLPKTQPFGRFRLRPGAQPRPANHRTKHEMKEITAASQSPASDQEPRNHLRKGLLTTRKKAKRKQSSKRLEQMRNKWYLMIRSLASGSSKGRWLNNVCVATPHHRHHGTHARKTRARDASMWNTRPAMPKKQRGNRWSYG